MVRYWLGKDPAAVLPEGAPPVEHEPDKDSRRDARTAGLPRQPLAIGRRGRPLEFFSSDRREPLIHPAFGVVTVRVNAVSPGPTRTEGTDAMGEGLEKLAAQAPAGRPATADEIAEAIVFLATDRSSFVQGAKLAVDGGRTAV